MKNGLEKKKRWVEQPNKGGNSPQSEGDDPRSGTNYYRQTLEAHQLNSQSIVI
jgi:hypothetical protein